MIGIQKYCKTVALAAVISGGLGAFATLGQAHDSQSALQNAQQELKNDGYYKGTVNGVDGPATRSAIRRYQKDNNLKATGRLDRETQKQLGIKGHDADDRSRANTADRNSADRNSADRSTAEADRYQQGAIAPSHEAVMAAQRRLHEKGFYKGNFDGRMGPETQAALREFQKNSNLNVTGKLDEATLSRLGVSK